MCGIAGSVGFEMDVQTVRRCMGHRGPDAQGSFRKGQVELHHLRLTILDADGGGQPMHYLNRYTIVFNGEIYNHLEVRQQLALQCATHSDTETLLHAFHVKGPDMLSLLDGMFAMAIYDSEKNTLFLARDRSGKKPLYYFRQGNKLVFASELNTLRALLPLSICETHLAACLRLGTHFRQQTPYVEVTELLQGHYMWLDVASMEMKLRTWWNIGTFYRVPPINISETEALGLLDEKLKSGVQRRLESSDVEVGSFLSGGIDSGLVSAMAARMHPGLQTFTVSFGGSFNEAPLARLVAEQYGTRHHEIHIGFDDLAENAEKIVAAYGEPFYDSSAIPSWYVSRAAAAHLKVVLNGDGADELFGGYRRYVPFSRYNFLKGHPAVRRLAGLAEKLLPPAHNKKSAYNYLHRLAGLASQSGATGFLRAGSDIFEGFEQHIRIPEKTYLQPIIQHVEEITAVPVSGLRQMMWLDFDITLFGDFLVKMDIATMAHSIEGRSPLLCKALLEWVPTLPDHLKIHRGTTKYLLRKLATRYLPETLWHQPKRGFEIPLKDWVNGQLKPLVHDYLSSAGALYPALVNKAFVDDLLQNRMHVGAEKRAKMLWTLTTLEIWYRHQRLTGADTSSSRR